MQRKWEKKTHEKMEAINNLVMGMVLELFWVWKINHIKRDSNEMRQTQ